MTDLIRKSRGKPLRDAMKRRGVTQAELAARTREVDVRGQGVSVATVAKVTGSGETAAEKCRLRTAWLLATALAEPLQDHFDMPSVSTDTVER
ncbi:helix-turn-helix transcriptional regulator [Streptomyces sp. NBC_00582]|uniref:helix-turn-helix transcriptional regulator n=1 Tax=Streptomyces sp. NBC_00582 TaxID=2975783 RepID=UPI002E822AF7|nr:helix-turn-helix transcriptional regulator [Streptomyces sp. NBC_00582]WUB63842.1 helix-turn-helix domain-containing protein [Streptomyces sp. NBC_00582]